MFKKLQTQFPDFQEQDKKSLTLVSPALTTPSFFGALFMSFQQGIPHILSFDNTYAFYANTLKKQSYNLDLALRKNAAFFYDGTQLKNSSANFEFVEQKHWNQSNQNKIHVYKSLQSIQKNLKSNEKNHIFIEGLERATLLFTQEETQLFLSGLQSLLQHSDVQNVFVVCREGIQKENLDILKGILRLEADYEFLIRDLPSGYNREIAGQLVFRQKYKDDIQTCLLAIKDNDLEFMDHYAF